MYIGELPIKADMIRVPQSTFQSVDPPPPLPPKEPTHSNVKDGQPHAPSHSVADRSHGIHKPRKPRKNKGCEDVSLHSPSEPDQTRKLLKASERKVHEDVKLLTPDHGLKQHKSPKPKLCDNVTSHDQPPSDTDHNCDVHRPLKPPQPPARQLPNSEEISKLCKLPEPPAKQLPNSHEIHVPCKPPEPPERQLPSSEEILKPRKLPELPTRQLPNTHELHMPLKAPEPAERQLPKQAVLPPVPPHK